MRSYVDFIPSQVPGAMGGDSFRAQALQTGFSVPGLGGGPPQFPNFPVAGSYMDDDKVNTLKELLRDPLLDPDSQREAQRRLMEMQKGNLFGDRADASAIFGNPDVQEYAQAMYDVKQRAGRQGNF